MPQKQPVVQLIITFTARYIPGLNKVGDDALRMTGNALIAFVLRLSTYVVNFIFNLVLARLIGAEGVGLYYQGVAIVTVASTVGQLGLSDTILRFASIHYAEEDWVRLIGLTRKGLFYSFIVSMVIALGILLSAEWMSVVLLKEPRLIVPLQLFALSIMPLSVSVLCASLIRAFDRITLSILINGTLLLFINLGLTILIVPILGINGAALTYVIASVVVLILAMFIVVRLLSDHLREKVKGDFDTRTLITVAMPLFWISLMNIVLSSADTLMIGAFADSASVGVYGVARRISNLASSILIAVNIIITPRFAILYAQNKHDELGNLVQNSTRLMTVIGLVVCLPIIVFPSFFLSIFGEEFISGDLVLILLVIAQLVNIATGSAGRLLLMSGHEKLVRNNLTFHVAFNLVLNVIFIPRFGVLGAAIVGSITLMSMNLVAVYLVYRYFGIFAWSLRRETP